MNFACPNRVLPCDNPADVVIRNFTSEKPDELKFWSLYYPPEDAPGFPDNPGPVPPPNLCEGDTQAEADLCSTQPDFPSGTAPQLFFSSAQTCTVNCSDGTTSTFTAPANLFYGPSLAQVNAQAFQFACEAATSFCSTPRPRNTQQTCNYICPDSSTASYTVAAGSFMGATQEEANNLAYSFACSVAAQLCDGDPPPPLFSNVAQSCSFTCPDGTSVTITIPAGTTLGLSQFAADSSAHELACALAQLACNNIPPLICNQTQTCTQNCPDGGSITYTVPAGVFCALDQLSANFSAFTYACLGAALGCQNGDPPPPPTVGNSQQQCLIQCDGGSFIYILPANSVRAESLAAANAQAASLACLLGQSEKVCLGAIQPGVCSGTAYASFISASGPVGQIVKTSGTLPPGITLSGGFLSGVATVEGTYTFTVQAYTSGGIVTRTYSIVVAGILTSALANGEVDTPYADALAQSGMTNPVWSLVGGTLPPGLSLSSSGIVSGTPTESGSFSFVVQIEG